MSDENFFGSVGIDGQLRLGQGASALLIENVGGVLMVGGVPLSTAASGSSIAALAGGSSLVRTAKGVTPGGTWLVAFNALSGANQAAQIALMVAAGVQWVRVDCAYRLPLTVDGFFDGFIKQALAAGIKVLSLFNNTSGSVPSAASYAAWATLAARRYTALGVTAFEVMNEPNITGQDWGATAPNAANYTAILKAAYTNIKAVNQNATVLLCGMAGTITSGNNISPVDYLAGIYAAGGGGFFDAANVHPYSGVSLPMQSDVFAFANPWADMLPLVRGLMVKNGDGAKGIWLTEFGADTGVYDQPFQALMVAQGYAQAQLSGYVPVCLVFDWQDSGSVTFGLYDSSGTAKLALKEFQAAPSVYGINPLIGRASNSAVFVTAGAQASAATVSTGSSGVAGATDVRGEVNVTALASGNAAGVLVTINWGNSGWSNPPYVPLSPETAAAAKCGLYVSSRTTTTAVISCANAPAASDSIKFTYGPVVA